MTWYDVKDPGKNKGFIRDPKGLNKNMGINFNDGEKHLPADLYFEKDIKDKNIKNKYRRGTPIKSHQNPYESLYMNSSSPPDKLYISPDKKSLKKISKNIVLEIDEDREILSVKSWLYKYGCDIDKYMRDIKVLSNKGSASDSVIMFGNLKVGKQTVNVVFKLIFKSKNKLNNSLIVEQQIYENVISNLINNYHTPHIVNYIGTVTSCTTNQIVEQLSLAEMKNFENALKQIDLDSFDDTYSHMMILEKSSGYTLHNCMSQEKLTSDEKFKILFQLLYTLLCFERIGLSQNDLHTSNIFVDKLDNPVERIYYIDNTRWVKFTTSYDAKIYDFDRGAIYHPAVDRNLTIDKLYCKTYETCNSFDSKRDLGSLIAGYLMFESNSEILNFLNPLVSSKFLNDISKRKYVQLNTSHSKYSDEDLKPIREYLNLVVNEISDVSIGDGSNKGNIYTLPSIRKHTFWYPTTSNTHQGFKFQMSDESVNTFDKEYISDIFTDAKEILNPRLYTNELNEIYDAHKEILPYGKQCRMLFNEFIKKKNVHKSEHLSFMIACSVLCLPFVYKFTFDEMGYFVKNWFNIKEKGDRLSIYVSDIWNTFDNTLPVKMVKM